MQLADPLTKDTNADNLRAAIKSGRYTLADEGAMLARRAEEKEARLQRGKSKQEENMKRQRQEKTAKEEALRRKRSRTHQ